MEIINSNDYNKARKEIQKFKNTQLVIVKSKNNEFNRKIFENSDVDIITDLELHSRKPPKKQRDSGLNEVHCKLASENNIKIGINLKKIIGLPKKQKALALARIMQNIQLCKRTNTKIIILGNYKKQDIRSLFLTLGGSTKQAKEALS